MKLTIIQPSIGKIKNRDYVKSWLMEPLNLAVLAGLTPQDVDISFYDDRVDEIPYNELTDAVAMPVETYTAKRTYSIAEKFKSQNIPVILGGVQTSLIPEEVIPHSDAIVIGDAEPVWAEVIEDLRQNSLKKIYKGFQNNRILENTVLRREIYAGKKYVPVGLVETGRGCPNHCDFCTVSGMYHGTYRTKALETIVSEVKEVNSKILFFVDDNFVSNIKRTKELCELLVPLKKNWMSHGSINMTNDPELLKLLEKSGCTNILIGFESLNTENLRAMGKSWNLAKRNYSDAISRLRNHGITIYGTFVFGYDHDKEDDIKRTLEFAIEQKIALAAFNHLVPFPGTPLYNRMKSEGRLLDDKWWLKENYKFGEVAFRPKNMSPERLTELCYQARCDFYKTSSIFHRMFDFKANSKNFTNALILGYTNFFSLKAVKERQSWPIGNIV